MEITVLIKSILGLVVLLGILLFLFMYSSSQNKKKQKKVVTKKSSSVEVELDLMTLRKIIKTKESSEKELKDALDLILKNYGHITKKLGTRTHPDFDVYMDILFSLCRHKNTNKNLIIGFDKELMRLNPEYKAEINDAVTKGLNSRGV